MLPTYRTTLVLTKVLGYPRFSLFFGTWARIPSTNVPKDRRYRI